MKVNGVVGLTLLVLAARGQEVGRQLTSSSRLDLFADVLARHAKTSAALGWRVAVA